MSISLPPASARESLPSLSGLYDVLFELGRGGMGTVSLARMAGLGGFERLVVVKRMNRELMSRPVHLKRFVNEAKIASHVHHANVVGVQLIGEDPDGYFLVLDYVEGESLAGLIDAAARLRERVPLPVVLRVAIDGLAGLHAIHEARDSEDRPLGILHRDISTCNLLVGADGVTRVTDFGVAKSTGDASLTGDLLVGKVLYMSPEYLLKMPVDRRMDVYAMGILLWLALADGEPWGSEISIPQLMSKAVSQGVPRLPASAAPPAVIDVIARACAKKPEARFETARAMAAALTKATSDIADPLDVAALVDHLAGARLRERRLYAGKRGSRPTTPPSRADAVETSAEVVSLPPPPPPDRAERMTEVAPAVDSLAESQPPGSPAPQAVSASIPAAEPIAGNKRWLAAGAVVAVALAVAATWFFRSHNGSTPEEASAGRRDSVPSAAVPATSAGAAPAPDPVVPSATASANRAPPKTKTGGKPATDRAPPTLPPKSPGSDVPGTISTGNPYR